MAMFKDFTFDGENSKDYGVYISGDAVYDAPERAMDMVQIPGRNGALALDSGYYNNIDVTYPAGCFADDQADFAAKLSRIRNMLASRHRYCRLEDAYHPDHFRIALYKSGLDVAPVARNKAGRFNITFDAKPQRFLKSGEVVQELDADAPPTTSYGPADIVTFEGEPGDAIVHGQWPLEPIQDQQGYDSPWPAGGGKNKLEVTASTQVINGITFTVNDDGSITATGTASAQANFYFGNISNLSVGNYILNGGGGNANAPLSITNIGGTNIINISGDTPFTVSTEGQLTTMRLVVQSGTTVSNYRVYPMIRLATEADATFAPYSNICPINGFTGAEVTAKGENLWDEETELGSINNDNGENVASNNVWRSFYIPVKPSSVIAIVNGAGYTLHYYFYTADKTFITSATFAAGVISVTVPDNAYYLRIRATEKNPTYGNNVSINYPSTDTAYHASVGTTHDITWQDEAGTIYGGTLQYMGGDAWRLTSDREYKVCHSGDVVGASNSTGYGMIVLGKLGYSNDSIAPLCNMLARWNGAAGVIPNYHFNVFNSAGYGRSQMIIRLPFTSSTGSEQARKYNDWLGELDTAGTPLTVCFGLTTPVVYDLTGDELQALIGTNNIFSNTGTTTITVQSPYELENPTLYLSKPLIRVYGSGTIQVNDITITVAEHSGYIDIDCDIMDCHRGADSMNQYVSFSGNDFPELQPGINRILLNGPDKVEITPRWWEL